MYPPPLETKTSPLSEIHKVDGVVVHLLVTRRGEGEWMGRMWSVGRTRAEAFRTEQKAETAVRRWFDRSASRHVCGSDCGHPADGLRQVLSQPPTDAPHVRTADVPQPVR